MSRDSVPISIAVAFFVVAAVAAFVLNPAGGALVGDEAVEAFLDAWRTSRLGTYVVESTFEREVPGTGTLVSPTVLVQRPPDRLALQFGGVDGRLDGRVLVCGTDPAGRYTCTQGAAAGDYDDEVDEEVERLASYFEGPKPLYRVTGDGRGCFRLLLALDFPSPPYGTSAQFCFDDDTGAQVLALIIRTEGTDTTRATSVRAEVEDSDLQVPEKPPEAVTTG